MKKKIEKKPQKTYLRVGDKVKVITGDQKGFLGNILSIAKKESTLIVEGITPRIRYMRNSQGGESKKVELPISIHISNVMLWDKDSNQISRIGYKIIEGKKKRYFKKSKALLP
jgi:large subunit ribosomal protein L24